MAKDRKSVSTLLTTLTGRTPDAETCVGKKMYGRKGTEWAAVCGKVTGTKPCTMRCCGGTRVNILWPDGKRTYPCLIGCKQRPDGDWEIL